jgi:hypothetical protein
LATNNLSSLASLGSQLMRILFFNPGEPIYFNKFFGVIPSDSKNEFFDMALYFDKELSDSLSKFHLDPFKLL